MSDTPNSAVPNTVVQTPVPAPTPNVSLSPSGNSQNISRKKKVFIIIIIIISLVGLVASVYLVKQQQILKSKATDIPSTDWKAKVNDEEISQIEVSQATQLLAYLAGKGTADSGIIKEALDYSINRRLLKKEADRQNLTNATQSVADQRFANLVAQNSGEDSIVQTTGADIITYKNYFLDQAIREALQANVSKWALVDYLSIRYLWHNNPEEEEINFQKIAEDKINDYYLQIQEGLDIKEAIKLRCQDPSIDQLPFGNHLKMYSTTFDDKTICREQRVNYKVGQDANKEWGEDWLEEVYQTPVGSTSKVNKYEKPAVGIYFIVKVLDKGGNAISLDDLIIKLRASNTIIVNE